MYDYIDIVLAIINLKIELKKLIDFTNLTKVYIFYIYNLTKIDKYLAF